MTLKPVAGEQNWVPSTGFTLRLSAAARVDYIVGRIASKTQVLEVVDVAAGIHIDLVLAKDGVEQALHVLTFGHGLACFSKDGMVTDDDNPIFVGGGQGAVYPSQLAVDVLLVCIGIFRGVLAVTFDERSCVDEDETNAHTVIAEGLGIVAGGHHPAA